MSFPLTPVPPPPSYHSPGYGQDHAIEYAPTHSIDQSQARDAGSSTYPPPPPPPAYSGPSSSPEISRVALPMHSNYEAHAARQRKLNRRCEWYECRTLLKFLLVFVLLIIMAACVIWYLSLEPSRDCEKDGKVNGERVSGKIFIGGVNGGAKCG